MSIIDHLFKFRRDIEKFNKIKNSDQAKTSKKYGVGAIVYSLVILAMCAAAPFLLHGLESGLVVMAFSLLGLLIAGCTVIAMLIGAIINISFQFKLNRGAIGYIAIAMLLVSVGGSVALIALLL